MLEKIAQNSYLNLLSGFALLVSSGYETWHTIDHFTLSAHYGVLIFSVIQILKSLPEVMDGVEKLDEAESAA